MSHFTLPEHFSDAQWEKVKKCALKKMATQFCNWKKRLHQDYVLKNKTPTFTGAHEELKDHWDVFVKYKKSDEAKKRSERNKINATNYITWKHWETSLNKHTGEYTRVMAR